MFEYLETAYFEKVEYDDRPMAHLTAFIHTLWINQGKEPGSTPEIIEPAQHRTRLASRVYPGWVKTVNGWVREEQLVQQRLESEKRAKQLLLSTKVDPNG